MGAEARPTTARDSKVLAAIGGGFLVLAGFFLWRDLTLPRELILLVATALAGGAAVLQRPREWPAVGPAALLGTVLAGGIWYVAQRGGGLLPALALGLVAALVTVARMERVPTVALAHRLGWYAFGAALLSSSWGFYFHFLTTGVASESVARRLIPTVLWLVVGLAIFVAARLRSTPATQVGCGLIAVALGKALLYDTTHLHGGLRVMLLAAIGGLLLFVASALRSPREAGSAPVAPERS